MSQLVVTANGKRIAAKLPCSVEEFFGRAKTFAAQPKQDGRLACPPTAQPSVENCLSGKWAGETPALLFYRAASSVKCDACRCGRVALKFQHDCGSERIG
jgi:hypothetical protein